MSQAGFSIFESSRGTKIHRLPVQAFPDFWAYGYVIHLNGRRVLVDTGSGTDTSHEDLLNGLNQAGLHPSDLTHILLTHAHIDHYGGLTKLKPLTPALVGCHELDSRPVAHPEAELALISRRLASFLAEAGLAAEAAESLLGIHRFTKSMCQSVPIDFTYDEINDHLPALDLIHLPGHSPGHVAIKLDDIIFCGDMVVEGITPHLSPKSIHPNSGLDQYLASLERFQGWAKDARLVLNGHDDAITDLPAQIDATRKNIIRRMSRAIGALGEPHTLAEVCNIVYENPAGYNLLLTVEKTGAYIEYLYEHGMVEIVNRAELEDGLPARYRRLHEIADEEILPKHTYPVAG